MVSFHTLSTIKYFSSDIINIEVDLSIITHVEHFATSNVAIWCWWTSWYLLALGCGISSSPIDLSSGSSWVVALWDSDKVWRNVDYWHVSSGGGFGWAEFWELWSGGHAITVQHSSSSLGVKTMWLVMRCAAVPAIEVGPRNDDHPICLLQ